MSILGFLIMICKCKSHKYWLIFTFVNILLLKLNVLKAKLFFRNLRLSRICFTFVKPMRIDL